ncbi:uroporphyrinogen decarboxylase [Paracraurococcus lichenis]|uniref:Uroporphyrinogen decarboxylase n=1 Tax=Paracraurococcus lichenis TaxID=3064888 RepID=A0ABT9E7D1_9PROT|nr:uroporphyrinogen decarboxylase [Paracraurococcus sp. LOR1-02]MDO9712097.1 uroporphyrinogen decarboxylase [Paracraurococcus sp. LOR1-02]
MESERQAPAAATKTHATVAKPMLRVLAGEAVWPPPMWLMRQAGRYLPEYREVRAQAGDFIALCTSPELAAEVTLQPIRRYGMDGAILFSDILMVPWAMGQPLRFAEGEGPQLEPVRDAAAIGALDPSAVVANAAPIFETVRLVRGALDAHAQKTTLIGFAGSPFTVACYMVEGHGSRDFATARGMAYAEPGLFGTLIRTLVQATTDYLLAQAAAGAEALMLFDSWAGMLSPSQFRRWVIEPTGQILRNIRKVNAGIPVIGFPRLAGPMLAEYAQRTGVQCLGVDTSMDLRWAASAVAPTQALQGNLDPLALVAGGMALEAEARSILGTMRGRPFVFNLGHGIEKVTPPEHVSALVRLVRTG